MNRTLPYFQTDSVMLFVDDCMEMMRSLPEGFVDMVFADSPYILSNSGITCYAGQRVSVNKGDWDKSRGFQDDTGFHDLNVEIDEIMIEFSI